MQMERLLEGAAHAANNVARIKAMARAAPEPLGRVQNNCPVHGVYMAEGHQWTSRPQSFGAGTFGENKTHTAWTPCPTCLEMSKAERDRKESERAAMERRMRVDAAIAACGIPQRFIGKRLSDFNTTTEDQRKVLGVARDYVERFAALREKGESLVFAGQPGTGKSLLAMMLLQELCEKGYSGRYTTLHGMIQSIRGTWGKEGEGREVDVLEEFSGCTVLVIDEVGAQLGSDSEKNLLFDIIDRRYADMRPTIMATNLDRKKFEEFVEPRTWDRLTEIARWIPFKGESYRPHARREMAS